MAEQTATELLDQAQAAFDDGDLNTAWLELKRVIEFPNSEDQLTEENWSPAFKLLTRLIGQAEGFDTLEALAGIAVLERDNVNTLYNLGYELIEGQLNRIAATVLSRANRIAPGHEKIVTELSTALEQSSMYRYAMDIVEEARTLGVDGPFPTYLLGFNAFLAGEAQRTRDVLPLLDPADDPNLMIMADRLAGFVQRHAQVEGVTPLDFDDLRGWHYAITGSILTHLSPHGIEVMRGRYAMLQDQYSLLREGIERLLLVLNTWKFSPSTVQSLPDRNSEVVGRAVSQRLGLQLTPFDPTPTPGRLTVAYDFFETDHTALKHVQERGDNEVLFAHAMCWTEDYPLTADVCTFQYQSNVSPWGAGRMTFNKDNNEMVRSDADNTPANELAQLIVESPHEPIEESDRAALATLAEHAGQPAPGPRLRYFAGSPVQSSRFV